MKIKSSIALSIIFNWCLCLAQFQASNWPTTRSNVIIKILPDSVETDTLPNQFLGFFANASISDSQGNLLFFSLGVDAKNKKGEVMDNGCCLCESPEDPNSCEEGWGGNPHVQGALILPRPGHAEQYFLFIKDMDALAPRQPFRVSVSLIDLSYNAGLGKVIQRATPILSDTLTYNRMTACRHANGRDWWLVNHEYNSNKIYTHLITPDSIYGPFEQYIGVGVDLEPYGWSLFSPDGSKFFTVTETMREITLLDFDRCRGTFSNYRSLAYDSVKELYSDLAISANGRFLYAGNARYIKQFDLEAADIYHSGQVVVYDTASYPLLGQIALMPDGKIYIAGWTGFGDHLSVIDSPDLKFPSCSFHLRSVYIFHTSLINSAPNFPNYNLGALPGSACDTLTGLDEVTRAEKERILKVFPNPAATEVTIDYGFTDWSKVGEMSLEISNDLGQIVYQQGLPRYSGFQKINISAFAAGLYSICIKRNGSVVGVAKMAKE